MVFQDFFVRLDPPGFLVRLDPLLPPGFLVRLDPLLPSGFFVRLDPLFF